MDTVLWIIQGVLAGVFLLAGVIKLTQPREKLAAGQMPYMEDLTDEQAKGIGAIELLAAVGLILPAALDIAPVLTPLAASGLVLVMLGAARTHIRRNEPQSLPVNLVLGGLALFVAVMRFGPESF